MRRRAYLAAATALTLAGCTGSGDPDDAGDDSDGDEPTPEGSDGSDEDGREPEGTADGSSDAEDSGDPDADGGEEGSGDSETGDGDDDEGSPIGSKDADDTDDSEDADDADDEGDGDPEEKEGDAGDEEGNEEVEPGEPVEPGTFDDFTDLSRWEVREGSLEATDRAYTDEQAGRLEAEVRDERVTIAYEFEAPRDLQEVVPGIAVAAEEMVVPTIQLVDAAGDRIDYRRAVRGGLPFMRYNFGESEVVGEPDLERVTELRIDLWTGSSQERSFRADDLHFTPRPETGKVMIQFDDTYDTDYTEGFPILAGYGYPAATFINPDRVGEDGWLSLDQLEELAAAGWTVGSHTLSHPDLAALDPQEQEAEIVGAAEWLAEHGFEGSRYFAYPFGQFDEHTVEIVEETHALGFAGGYPVQGQAVNPALCSRIGDPDADRAREMIDRTAEMGGITCLFYHRLDDELLEEFEAAIDHLADLESAGDLEVITPHDLEADLQFRG